MKRLGFIIILFFINILLAQAKEIEVTFSKCVDGDTARFIYNGEEIKVRFLAIDTPETIHPTKGEEVGGKNASNYTCEKLTNANKIILEFDENSDEVDKYDRYLVWVFVDDKLLQNELIKLGYAKVAYLYGDYKYTTLLESNEQIAKNNKIGIWSDYNAEEPKNNDEISIFVIIGIIILLLLIIIFSKKNRKEIVNKTKKNITNKVKKELKGEIKKLIK